MHRDLVTHARPAWRLHDLAAKHHTSQEAVSVTQPLELNGSRDARLRIAMGASGASAAEAEVSQGAVALAARTAYWDAVLARAVVDLDRQNVQHAQTLAEAATAQVNLGNQPKMHQIKAELEVARANQQLLASEAGAVQAEATLCSAMGVPPGSRVSLTESLVFAAAAVDDAGRQPRQPRCRRRRPHPAPGRGGTECVAGDLARVGYDRRGGGVPARSAPGLQGYLGDGQSA